MSAQQLVAGHLAKTPEASRDKRASALRSWSRWCGSQRITVLTATPVHVVRYLDDLRARGLATSTIASRLSVLRVLYAYAVGDGHMASDPTSSVRAPKVTRISRGTWLTRDELRAMLAAADRDPDPSVTALIWMLALQGVRLSEPLGMDVQDVELVRGRVIATLTRKGHGGARSQLLLARPVGTRVLAAVGDRSTGPLLVHFSGGRLPAPTARQMVTGTAMQAGITVTVTPHALRRSFVTLGRDAKILDRDLQASTGHRGSDMLDYYDRGRDAVTRDGGDQFAAYLGLSDSERAVAVAVETVPPRPRSPAPLTSVQRIALARLRGVDNRRLTADRVCAVADMIADGRTLAEIVRAVGLGPGRVMKIVREHDLPYPTSPRRQRLEQVRALAAQGLPSTAIAREVGITAEAVLHLIANHHLTWPRPDAPTPAARALRQARAAGLHAAGASIHEIAADLGVSLGTISRYLNNADVRSNRPWTPAETTIALDPDLTAAQAGQRLARTASAVSKERAKHRDRWRNARRDEGP